MNKVPDKQTRTNTSVPRAQITTLPQVSRQAKASTMSRRAYPAIIAAHIALVLGVAVFIYTSGSKSDSTEIFVSTGAVTASAPIDEISSADVAVAVAQLAGLDEAIAVMNNADSADAMLEKPIEDLSVAKPQIVATETSQIQDIIEYTTLEGDTVDTIAKEFGVSADSIKWSNDLPAGRLTTGKTIVIPPVEGIVYTVKEGDTPDTLADKFNSSKQKIVAFNDAELTGIVVGQTIVIPGGEIEAPPAYTQSAVGFTAVYGPANGYDWGWCTWHVANRRIEIGKPIPRNLGNAVTWSSRANASGMTVSGTPIAGAVLWVDQAISGYIAGGLGHVGYVESVNEDGSILVSDMNSRGFANSDLSGGPAGGWSKISYRVVTPDQFYRYTFIY